MPEATPQPNEAPSGAPGIDSSEPIAGTPEAPAAAAPALSPELTQLQTRLAQAEQTAAAARQESEAIRRYVVEMSARPQVPPVDPQVEADQFRELLDRNPRAAMDYAVAERLQPMRNELEASRLSHAAEVEYRTSIEKLASHSDPLVREEWQAYASEVAQFLEAMPLDVRAKPGVVESAFTHVKAAHQDEVVTRRVNAVLARERNGGLEAPSGGRGAVPTERPLTPDQRRMAAAFGISEKDYQVDLRALEQGGA